MANRQIQIKKRIYTIRGKRVMLDSDLAYLYKVEVKRLNEAVKRNIKRFPGDFMIRLTKNEFAKVVAICDHLQNQKFRPTLPYAFTEQGVAMLEAVLNSQKAIDVNIQIMRAFFQLRNYVLSGDTLNQQIVELRNLFIPLFVFRCHVACQRVRCQVCGITAFAGSGCLVALRA